MAAGHTDTDSDSDTDSNCSDCSEQSVYDDEAATSVQPADAMLSDLFFAPGAPATFQAHASAGSARFAVGEDRPAPSAWEQAQAEMLAKSRVHAAELARSEQALLQAQQAGAAAAAELARHMTAAQAALNTPKSPPVAPTAPEITIGSVCDTASSL